MACHKRDGSQPNRRKSRLGRPLAELDEIGQVGKKLVRRDAEFAQKDRQTEVPVRQTFIASQGFGHLFFSIADRLPGDCTCSARPTLRY